LTRIAGNRILVVGRAGLDLYADPPGARVEEAAGFVSALGGSAANIAVACARLGGRVALFTSVSDDAVGCFVVNQLTHYSIDTRYVSKVGGQHRTSLAVVETRAENCQNVLYRNNAADFELNAETAGRIAWSDFDCLIATGTCLSIEPSRSITLRLLEAAKSAGVVTILDVDYRPYSWRNTAEAAEVCGLACDLSSIVVGNDDEFDVLAEGNGGKMFAKTLATEKGKLVVYKMGANGSITFDGQSETQTGVFKVNALKPTGAGDAFMGGFIMGIVDERPIAESVARGSANAAMVVTRVGCAPAMPNPSELDDFIAHHPGPN
jgi:5-dehydro-2-deoxygluconokinase